jgi:hypothetical protein
VHSIIFIVNFTQKERTMKKTAFISGILLVIFTVTAFCQENGLLQKRLLTFNGSYFQAPYTWYNDVSYPTEDLNWCIWGALGTAMLYNKWPAGAYFSGPNGQQIPQMDYSWAPYYFNYNSLLAAWPANGSLNTTSIVPLAIENQQNGFVRSDVNSRAIYETTRLYYAAARATGVAQNQGGAVSILRKSNHPKLAYIAQAKLGFPYTQAIPIASASIALVKSHLTYWQQPIIVLGDGHAYWMDGYKLVGSTDYVRIAENYDVEGKWMPWTKFISSSSGLYFPPLTLLCIWSPKLGTDTRSYITLYYGDNYIPNSGGNTYWGRVEVKNVSSGIRTIMYRVSNKAGTVIFPTQTVTCNPGQTAISNWFNFSVPSGTDYEKLTISFGGNYTDFYCALTEDKGY